MVPKGIVIAIYTFAFLTGFPSNLLACYTFLKKVRQKPVPIDILLLNLTISDLFLLIFLPFKVVEAAYENASPLLGFICRLTNFFFYSSIYLSTHFLMGISIERYLCIAYPVKHKLYHKPLYAIVPSIFFWFWACLHCGSIVYVVEFYDGKPWKRGDNFTCYQNFTSRQQEVLLPLRLEICIVLFCLPLIITLFCYINVIRILSSMPNIKANKKQRAVGLAVATMLNFAIVFAPYNISHVVGFINWENPSWRVETFFLTSLNTTLDPIIFFFSSSTIRRTFANCWLAMHSKRQAVRSLWFYSCFMDTEDKSEESQAGQMPSVNLPSILAGSSTPVPLRTDERIQASEENLDHCTKS